MVESKSVPAESGFITVVTKAGEVRTLKVVGTAGYGLRVEWPLAGVYTLKLKENVLAGAPLWSAQDHAAAVALWHRIKPANPFWWDKRPK